jgi:hypothetical protein
MSPPVGKGRESNEPFCMDYRGDGCEDEAGDADEVVPEVRPQAGRAGREVDRRGQMREVRGESTACSED